MLNQSFDPSEGFGQMAVDEREFPLHDVAIRLRREVAHPITQHICRGEFDAGRGLTARVGILSELRIPPKEACESWRMACGPTDAMPPSFAFVIPERLQKSRAADVQFLLKRAWRRIWLRQPSAVSEPFVHRDQHRAGADDQTGFKRQRFAGRDLERLFSAIRVLVHEISD